MSARTFCVLFGSRCCSTKVPPSAIDIVVIVSFRKSHVVMLSALDKAVKFVLSPSPETSATTPRAPIALEVSLSHTSITAEGSMLLPEKAGDGGSRTTSDDLTAAEGPEVEVEGETEEATINAKMM